MRNHNEKARDMARSILPSTGRKGARFARKAAHGRERARWRTEAHSLRQFADPDDFDGDLTWQARTDLLEMVERRRSADKVAPLMGWARRSVERDPVLRAASPPDREAHFRRLLPAGMVGEHALSHLRWVLDDDDPARRYRRRVGVTDARSALVAMVEAIVASGLHGDLNRRIRGEVAFYLLRDVYVPARRRVDEEHPPPGVLVPGHRLARRIRRRIRFLAGAHDIEDFVNEASDDVKDVVRAVHAELIEQPDPPTTTTDRPIRHDPCASPTDVAGDPQTGHRHGPPSRLRL